MTKKLKIVAVTGPTATGKTALAVNLARKFGGEIISVDSRQVYRHLDIGTGKDIEEYGEIPCHLIDIVPPGGEYHLKAFCADAAQAVEDIASRGKLPILCGGTALYLHAFLRGYTLPGSAPAPEVRARLDRATLEELQSELSRLDPGFYSGFSERDNFTRVRRQLELRLLPPGEPTSTPAYDALVLGVLYPRAEVRARIEERLDRRLEAGMVDEVRRLHDEFNMSWEKLEFLGLEYRFVAEYLQGATDFDEMRRTLLDHIRQFAKRQDIFFRKMEREGVDIHWIERGDPARAEKLMADFLAGNPPPGPGFRLMNFKN
ncbi:MAG: tRNA (adenosine(37)-N6)-dimethylallyltransferase MiaA [Victivallaceae bacterium]|nr:tRNA (adenosine(37)-N6)-dimethylallyltransferase MiaA [Victivallaceae bacterium]